MPGRLFKPSLTLAVGGQLISNLTGAGLRVTFRVLRTMTATPDSCEVQIYNLGEIGRTTIQAFFDALGASPLILSTGYEGVVQQLFAGDVRSMQAKVKSPPDVITRFTADDGGDAVADAIAPSSTLGLSPVQMVDVAIAAMNLSLPTIPITAHPSVAITFAASTVAQQTQVYTSVSIGRAWDIVEEAARAMGARAWLRDSQIHMTARGLPSDQAGLGVNLTRALWLSEPDMDGGGIMRLSALMDPSLVPGRLVNVIGRVSPASIEPYRIEAAEYAGDMREGPWSVSMHLKAQTL